MRCVCGCGKRGTHRHHAIYAQHVRQHGGKVMDPRNLVWMAHDCHWSHHFAQPRVDVRRLPDRVFEFARELMGAGAAYEYLKRRYGGDDPRLDRLLEESAA